MRRLGQLELNLDGAKIPILVGTPSKHRDDIRTSGLRRMDNSHSIASNSIVIAVPSVLTHRIQDTTLISLFTYMVMTHHDQGFALVGG